MELQKRTAPFVAVLIGAMVVSTIQVFAIAVLAADIIDELDISRWQIGLLGAANTGVGAVLAPRLGHLTDELGARRSTELVFFLGAVGLILTGLGTTFWVLVVASLVSGVSQGWGNSATNKLIANRPGLTNAGALTGIKQSGVQFSAFLAGLGMPALAQTVNWHVGLVGVGVFFLLAGLLARLVLVADTPAPVPTGTRRGGLPLPIFVYQVAAYALFMGLASGGVGRFLPLFANEELGFSVQRAGVVVAFQGLLGIFARLAWGRATESVLPLRESLLVMAVGSVFVFVLLLLSADIGGWVLWPVAALMAFTTSAWNVVAMLAVIKTVSPADAGRATGVVMMTFLSGLTISGPVMGWSVDQTGSYNPAWWVLLVLTLLGALSVARDVSPREPKTVSALQPATE